MFSCCRARTAATGSDACHENDGCGANWNDLPTEMKLEVVKRMSYPTKKRFRLCSKLDYELVESTYSFHIPYMEIKGPWNREIRIHFALEPHKKVCFEVEEDRETGRCWMRLKMGSDRVRTRELLFEKSYEPFDITSMLISLLSNKKIIIGMLVINDLYLRESDRLMEALVKTDTVGKWILGSQNVEFFRERMNDLSFEYKMRDSVTGYCIWNFACFVPDTISPVPPDSEQERNIVSACGLIDCPVKCYSRLFDLHCNIFLCAYNPHGFETDWFILERKTRWPWVTKVDENKIRFTSGRKVVYAKMSECGTIIQVWPGNKKELPVGELKFYTETFWKFPSGKQAEWYWDLIEILDRCINQTITVQ